jgi:hypothetical protein
MSAGPMGLAPVPSNAEALEYMSYPWWPDHGKELRAVWGDDGT